jgi:hypothetical protein
MSSHPPTHLLQALRQLQIRGSNARPQTIVMAPVQQETRRLALPAPVPAYRRLLRPLMAIASGVARRLLRHPRAKRAALGLLARVPGLRTQAIRIVSPDATLIALEPLPLDRSLAAALTPRARLAARRLQQAVTKSDPRTLPPVGDDKGWDRLVAALCADRMAARPARPRLAFVSPLPPERTGIADYAVQLLPALCTYFEIELVVQQDTLDLPPALAALPVRDVDWLRANAHTFDDILYQIGNSEFHRHMFALLRDHPGVVVLHDFFLGNVMAYRQMHQDPPGAWTGALFHSHGFPALQAYQQGDSRPALLKSHPCNLAVLEQARSVIVHSAHAAELACTWYGTDATRHWQTVPLPRAEPAEIDRRAARAALGIGADVFLVCSFGYIGQNKLTDRLVAGWLASALHGRPDCLLVLVGANHDNPFGARIDGLVRSSHGSVRIAGWSDDAVYRQYLQAADAGVQLRTSAQGETSAAVLDCMNYGLPTIVNANGSMAALPSDAVMRLPDVFEDAQLIAALETLHGDAAYRTMLGQRAASLLASEYRPEHGAARYAAALNQAGPAELEKILAPLVAGRGDAILAAAAAAIARRPASVRTRQLLVDIGACAPDDRDQLVVLLGATNLRVELVRLRHEAGPWRMEYARRDAAQLLGWDWETPDDALADMAPGDVFYSPALQAPLGTPAAAAFWQSLRERGVALAFAVPANPARHWYAAIAPVADLLVFADEAGEVAWHEAEAVYGAI